MSAQTLLVATTALLLAVGAAGVLFRRNPVSMLMALEIMLNAANLLIVLGGRTHGSPSAYGAALIVLVIGAAEVVVGLGLAVALFRNRARVDIDDAREVRG